MKIRAVVLCMLVAPLSSPLMVAYQDQPTVFLRGTEVYARRAGTDVPRQLTDDGVPKRLLAQSIGGDRIAFLRESPGLLADVVTIRIDGSGVREIRFRPTGVATSLGMRFVEALKWITASRLALAGSLNPSTCEYAVIDADTGVEVGSYLTDGFSLSGSPDGNHVAYVGQIPHFMLEEKRHPQFCLDDECVFDQPYRGYQRAGVHLEYRSAAIWSPDSSAVATIATEYDSGVERVVVRHVAGPSLDVAAPTGRGGRVRLLWDGHALVVLMDNEAWRLEPGAAELVRSR